jgi:very-short-patch-repair endonuclease
LLEGDLVWRKQRVIGEYQGADHASIRRRSADASRLTSAEAEGYRILEIYAEDVFGGARRRACLHRFARALAIDPAELTIC